MGKITGFLEYPRREPKKLPVVQRVRSYSEFELPPERAVLNEQAARCMDCGIPFCTAGCPLGNLIPDWNESVYQGRDDAAAALLHATNNFPEVTGRVCPAPCEAACVLGINAAPVSIKLVERAIADHVIAAGPLAAQPAATSSGHAVAVIGSGPAGLAAAQQLARLGHAVTVYERADRIGGLLTYGIPDFKLEKSLVARRVEQLRAEGVRFVTGADVGQGLPVAELERDFDAICLAIGSRTPRDLPIEGRALAGIEFAMDFLEQQNRRVAGDSVPDAAAILATGKHVVVIGGGDTGSDCIGTSHRQGALSVSSLEIMPRPPEQRDASTPWPLWPLLLRTSSSHEEGGERLYSVMTTRFVGEQGRVTGLCGVRVELRDGRPEPISGTEFTLPADLVLLAMGFVHPEREGPIEAFELALDRRGNVEIDERCMTSRDGVFAAGDCQRGQSLVVWAIADGRRAAAGIDRWLAERRSAH
ncbi:MAG: glutamate synthase subunit beta [Polyangiaceae bacterium]|nr:glutamate synthase subunit beta [Polyangiaceae bacterium]